MAEATLNDVVETLRAQGALTRNSGTNSIKSAKNILTDIQIPIATMEISLTAFIDALNADSLKKEEQAREQQALFEDIRDSIEGLELQAPEPAKENSAAGVGILGAGLAVPAIIAFVTSMYGLDDELRAAKIATLFPRFARTIGRIADGVIDLGKKIGNFVESVKNFRIRIPELPTIRIVDFEGKPLSFDKFKIRTPELPRLDAKAIGDSIKGAIMKPINLLSKDGKLFEDVAKTIDTVKTAVTNFFNRIPRLSITMPEGVGSITESVARVFGSVEGGTGVLGFLGKVFNFIEPLLKPFKMIIGTIMRPFVQVFLSIIDFVTGFYKGFTGEDGSFMDKITAGIEGGILGVITGITDAIDLILFKLPAWIAEKLGFEKTAEALGDISLSEMVRASWDKVKETLSYIISGEAISDLAASFGDFDAGALIKAVLRTALPNPEGNLAAKLASMAIPDSVYEYAGLDPSTGELLPTENQEGVGGELDSAQKESNQLSGTSAPIIVQDNSVQNVSSNTNSSAVIQDSIPAARKNQNVVEDLVFSP